MNRTILIAAAAVIVALGGWLLWRGHGGSGGSNASTTPAVIPVAITQTPGVEVQYFNTALKFSFMMPDGVLAQEFPGTSGTVVRLHRPDTSTHLVVSVASSKTDPDAFTADTVAKDAPGMQVSGASSVQMPGGITALEFTSTSAAWGGPSRELWFAHDGKRYQVSTPLADAKLLDFVRDSWQWRK